jgi:hypothetical protein
VVDLIETAILAIVVLDRATHGTRLGDTLDGPFCTRGLGPVAVLEVDRDRKLRGSVHSKRVLRHLLERAPDPSSRPRVNANPELVVASALKPSASSTRADPGSHGFGITNGSPAWSA